MKAIFYGVIAITLGIVVDAKDCNKICTLEIDRVCGTDGYKFKVFANKCIMDVQACEDSTVWRTVRMTNCESVSNNFFEKDRSCAFRCTKEYRRVCGFNGESYQWFNNECLLKKQSCLDKKTWTKTISKACYSHNQTVTHETTNCFLNCTNIFEPVCGFNGTKHRIFDNKCMLQKHNCTNNFEWKTSSLNDCLDNIKFPQIPPIVCRRPCPKIYNPVCGYDGVSYRKFSTGCVMENQNCENGKDWVRTKMSDCDRNSIVNNEEKKSDCNTDCPYTYDAICGFDGKDFKIFANKCILNNQHCIDNHRWRIAKMHNCLEKSSDLYNHCPIACPLNYKPVCGFNGRKYKLFANECQYRFANCRSNYSWEKANFTSCESIAFA